MSQDPPLDKRHAILRNSSTSVRTSEDLPLVLVRPFIRRASSLEEKGINQVSNPRRDSRKQQSLLHVAKSLDILTPLAGLAISCSLVV
jgi:hypothetical protein